jgi:hypothetical protein
MTRRPSWFTLRPWALSFPQQSLPAARAAEARPVAYLATEVPRWHWEHQCCQAAWSIQACAAKRTEDR